MSKKDIGMVFLGGQFIGVQHRRQEMEHVAECIKAAGSAVGALGTAWAFAIIICNGIKMICAAYLVDNCDMEPTDAKELMKIEPVWFWKKTTDTVNKVKNKW